MSPLQKAADALLRERGHDGIDRFLADLLAQGRSYRSIERALEDATGGAVMVSHETLRTWVGAAKDAA